MTIEELREIMAERRLTQSDIAKMIEKRYVGDGLYVVNYGGNLLVKRL